MTTVEEAEKKLEQARAWAVIIEHMKEDERGLQAEWYGQLQWAFQSCGVGEKEAGEAARKFMGNMFGVWPYRD